MVHNVSNRQFLLALLFMLGSNRLCSQVSIKERVEIKPQEQTRPAHVASTYDLFSPPLFINLNGQPVVTLASSLTMSATVSVLGDMGTNQEAIVVYVAQNEHQLAWQGRASVGAGGGTYSGSAPYTDSFSAGTCPDIELYLLDVYDWGNGARQVTESDSRLDFTFSGFLRQGPIVPDVPVQASAQVTGNFLSWATINSWQVTAYPEVLTCAGTSKIVFGPEDGTGAAYDPKGKELMSGTVTVSVQAAGDYVYLRKGNQQGKTITLTLPQDDATCDLVLDAERDTLPAGHDVAVVTVQGGGKSGSASVNLICDYANHFAVTTLPDTILYGDFAYVSAVLVDNDGNEVPLDGDTPITVTATPDATGWLAWWAGPIAYRDLKEGYLVYEANGQEPVESQDVTIRAEGAGKAGTGKLVVTRRPCLVMQLSKSTVSLGDTVDVTFLQRDYGGALTSYPANQLFDVRINSGDSYGILQSPGGQQGTRVTDVQPIQFIAIDSISTDSVIVVLEAEATSGGIAVSVRNGPKAEFEKQARESVSKLAKILSMSIEKGQASGRLTGKSTPNAKLLVAGQLSNNVAFWNRPYAQRSTLQDVGGCTPTGMIVVKEALKIKVTVTEANLTPLGDNDNIDNPNYNENGPDKRVKVIDWKKRKSTEVIVSVTDGANSPLPKYPFTLHAFVRPNSGGHDHNNGRPRGKFVTPNKDTVETFQGTTNADGKAMYTYISSGIGGVDSIFVKGKTDRDTSTATILLRFSGLIELTSGDHCVLIGAHSQGANSQHEKNHFGTATSVKTLKSLADTVFRRTKSRLRYNDMSLIYGGPFDIDNDWDTPHQDHRNGVSADVSDQVLNGHNDLVGIDSLQIDNWLRLVSKSYSILKEASHYHITTR